MLYLSLELVPVVLRLTPLKLYHVYTPTVDKSLSFGHKVIVKIVNIDGKHWFGGELLLKSASKNMAPSDSVMRNCITTDSLLYMLHNSLCDVKKML